MASLLARIWRLLRGQTQWYVLWFLHSKFVIGVSGVVFDQHGQVLLLQHRFWADGSWGLPGGYINRGETLEQALCREVAEETGYQIRPQALLRLVSGYRLRLEASFVAQLVGGTLRLDGAEVLAARFFAVEALPAGLIAPHRALIALAVSQTADDGTSQRTTA